MSLLGEAHANVIIMHVMVNLLGIQLHQRSVLKVLWLTYNHT